MKRMQSFVAVIICLLMFGGVTIFLANCSSDSAGTATFSSLTDIPSLESMISGTGANASGLTTVSGTPPALIGIGQTDVDALFWDGLLTGDGSIAAIGASADATEIAYYYGATVGGPGGEPACHATQNVTEIFRWVFQSATSACYMRNMPGTTGVTITPTLADPSTLFNQGAEDRIVQVNVTNHPSRPGPETVYIRIPGASSAAANTYESVLWFCEARTVTGYETNSFNSSTGAFSMVSTNSHSNGDSTFSATGTLTHNGSSWVFDPNQDREIAIHYENTWGRSGTSNGKQAITFTSADWMKTKRYYSWTDSRGSGTDKMYAIAAYSGSSIDTARLLQVAFKGENTWSGRRTTNPFLGALEYQDSYYKNVATDTNELYSSLSEVELTDAYYTGLTAPTVDTGAYTCSPTVDYEVTMDFSLPAILAIATTCDTSIAYGFEYVDLCWDNSAGGVTAARAKVWAGWTR